MKRINTIDDLVELEFGCMDWYEGVGWGLGSAPSNAETCSMSHYYRRLEPHREEIEAAMAACDNSREAYRAIFDRFVYPDEE